MFEKYTEKARKAIFHAREETSKFGTPRIESEQLLLGLLAADKSAARNLTRGGFFRGKITCRPRS
jgi:ATP-dependent Clp protease ATP-binding subunit ClpA